MDKIQKIRDLMDNLMEAITDAFPESTKAMISLYEDGYRSIAVEKWDDDYVTPASARKRRSLLDQIRIGGEWSPDRSDDQNDFYLRGNVLLEKGNGNGTAT